MDYSLGLEVGHDFFWANYAALDRLAEITLCNSYTLLEREEYKTILTEHMKVRRAKPELNYWSLVLLFLFIFPWQENWQ